MHRETVDPLAVKIPTAARMMDMSPSTVAAWLRAGRLPGRKVGRSWRVRVSDLKALVEAQAEAQAR
jgi:excisionase family DNA binding protein